MNKRVYRYDVEFIGTKYEVYEQRFEKIFREHCPKSLRKIPGIIERYGPYHYLHEFYCRVCQKYRVKPEPKVKAEEESSSEDDEQQGVIRMRRELTQQEKEARASVAHVNRMRSTRFNPRQSVLDRVGQRQRSATTGAINQPSRIEMRAERRGSAGTAAKDAKGLSPALPGLLAFSKAGDDAKFKKIPVSPLSKLGKLPTPKMGTTGQQIDPLELRAKFNQIDEDKDGKINFREWCFALNDLGIPWQPDKAKRIWKQMDLKKDKGICFSEFQAACQTMDPDLDVFFRKLFDRSHLGQTADFETVVEQEEVFSEGQIMELVSSKRSDWKKRNKAFGQMATLMNNKGLSSSGFREKFAPYVDPLKAQICERRSTVVKAVCEAVSAIATERRENFREFMDELSIALLEASRSSIKTISNAAKKCCHTIYQEIPEQDDCLLNGLKRAYSHHSKYCGSKEAALSYLADTLEQDGAANRGSDYWSAVMEFIQMGVDDSNPKVRDSAFKALFVAELTNLDRAKGVLTALTDVQKKKYARTKSGSPRR